MIYKFCIMFIMVIICTLGHGIRIKYDENTERVEKFQKPSDLSASNEEPRSQSNDYLDDEQFNEIPLGILEQLNEISSIKEFEDRFVMGGSNDEFEKIQRSGVKIAEPATCLPELQVYPLLPENQPEIPGVIYFPTCTRIKRCGGCCTPKHLFQCEPTEIENITLEMYRYQYQLKNGKYIKTNRTELVIVEQHKKCKCGCRKKASDCKPSQIYNEKQCKCSCPNLKEKKKCFQEDKIKIWDEDNCVCRCRGEPICSSGLEYDEFQCKCVPDGSERHELTPEEIAARRQLFIPPVRIQPTSDTKYSLTGN